MSETVQIDISIEISTQCVFDTGLTVEEWNAKTDAERYAIARAMWEAEAERDNGGMSVVTPGAEPV